VSTLRPLEVGDRDTVTAYLKRFPPEVSELTFTNLFVWRKSRAILFVELEDSLVLAVETNEGDRRMRVAFASPWGEGHPKRVVEALGIEFDGFLRVPAETARELERSGEAITPDRDNWDYVHWVKDLAELSGRKYHKKRNLVKQCLEANEVEYEEINGRNLEECLDFQDRWCRARECGRHPGLCAEYLAIRETFEHYEDFDLFGGAVRIGENIEAYAIGEELSPGTAVCHFEKAMPEIRGLGQVINQWFAKFSLGPFEFLNREQDLGIPGLRQAKESYYPHHMVEKFKTPLSSGAEALALVIEPHECAKHMHGHRG
jgi:hypothetical protein